MAPLSPRLTSLLIAADVAAGFSCGEHALDDYFARHALKNQAIGIGNTYVCRSSEGDDLPPIIGYYTLSMAAVESAQLKLVLPHWLPRYPMPAALLGRFAISTQAQRRGFGERLLMDALQRVLEAAEHTACTGVIVDAKTPAAARFYAKYDFVELVAEGWPRRMFIPIGTMSAAFRDP